jgi:hypothetical protein
LPEDEIRSIMGQAIPPEWTEIFLALGKEPWRFKDLEDQLNMYRQQWQADQQKQIIAKKMERCQAKQMKKKEKVMMDIIKTQTEDAFVLTKAIPAEEDVEEVAVDAVEEETTIVSI